MELWQTSHLGPVTPSLQEHAPVLVSQRAVREPLTWQPQALEGGGGGCMYVHVCMCVCVYMNTGFSNCTGYAKFEWHTGTEAHIHGTLQYTSSEYIEASSSVS